MAVSQNLITHICAIQAYILSKSIDMLYKNTFGVKKSEAKSEAPFYVAMLFMLLHATKRCDIW